jgi:catechol 2,3-dioxygenase-like lactoylglutathione lyase family enzyme
MIRGIHHVAISTGDLERSLHFYRDLLGFEEAERFDWQAGTEMADSITGLKDSAAKSVMLRAGNAYVELFEYQSPPPQPGDPERPVCDHGITHLCLDVTDIDALYERLVTAGMRFHCPPQDAGSGIRTTYGRDPDGNVVEIQQIEDDSRSIALSRAG